MSISGVFHDHKPDGCKRSTRGSGGDRGANKTSNIPALQGHLNSILPMCSR